MTPNPSLGKRSQIGWGRSFGLTKRGGDSEEGGSKVVRKRKSAGGGDRAGYGLATMPKDCVR